MQARKEKLLVVIGTLTHMGGAERQALYLVQHLATLRGCDVEVLTFGDGDALRLPLEALGVPVHVVPYYFRWPKARRARALARIAWLLRTHVKPDALLPFGAPSSKAMGLVARYAGARFCWWNQQDEGRELAGTGVERRILREMTCITSNSVAGQTFLSQTYDLNPASVLIYNNGTPLPDASLIRSDWRRRLNLGQRRIVSMIANVTEYKDHDTLIDAWATVRRHVTAFEEKPALLLAGFLKETATVTKLKIKAFNLGLSADDVYFLGAIDDVDELIVESDVVVHSSLTEGCPNAVCEAMALSRAVVATDIPGCRQALGEQGDRWLAAPGNPDDMARKIIELLNDASLRRCAGATNRARIESEFSISGMNSFFQRQLESGLQCSLGGMSRAT